MASAAAARPSVLIFREAGIVFHVIRNVFHDLGTRGLIADCAGLNKAALQVCARAGNVAD